MKKETWVQTRTRGTAHKTRAQAEDQRGAGEPPGPNGSWGAAGAAGSRGAGEPPESTGSPMEAGEPPEPAGSRRSPMGAREPSEPQAQALPHGAEGAEPVDILTSHSQPPGCEMVILFFTPRGLWQLSGQPSATSTEGLPGNNKGAK